MLAAILLAQEMAVWRFEPTPDAFSPQAMVDLRGLNERVAGESGYVGITADGGFKLGNGKPVRFWCVNSAAGREKPFNKRPLWRQPEPDLARHAKFLAKRGVNMVRLHAFISPGPNQALTDINEAERAWIWRAVAAYKKEGIYTTISPYFALVFKNNPAWGFGLAEGQDTHGLLFFHPKLQAAYRGWLKALLTPPNPETGIPLAKDPSVAIFQIQNEDSLLFWTFNALRGEPKKILLQKFQDWSVRKGRPAPSDFQNLWEMSQPRTGARALLLDDQLEFLTETMKTFNQGIVDYVRQDLGCKALINAGNWKTADDIRLNDAERYSYSPGEVMAVNRYYTGEHKGPNNGWAISNGDTYNSPSILQNPKLMPTNLKQVKGRPMIITESGWVLPHEFGAEGPFLVAAYQSVTGVDGFYWFSMESEGYAEPQSANGYMPSQSKWQFATPDVMGSFPAAAYLFRMGLLKQSQAVVSEERSLAEIFQRKTPIAAEVSGFDPNRDFVNISRNSPVKQAAPAEAFLMGPVEVTYGGDSGKNRISPSVSAQQRPIVSSTREVSLDDREGWCRINAPNAQGVAAFFNRQKEHKLADLTVTGESEFATVLAVSLDGQPLKTSKKVLVQAGVRSRPNGWKTSLAGGVQKVENFGSAPWMVTSPQLTIRLENKGLRTATSLDANMMPAGSVSINDGAFRFPLGRLYVVLTP